MHKLRYLCLATCCAQAFFLGFESAGLQLVLQKMGSAFNVTQSLLGNLIALQYLALMTIPIIFGRLSDRYGKRYSSLCSCLVFIIGCFLVISVRDVYLLALGIFLCGSGYGISETTGVASLFEYFPNTSDRKISLMQAFFSVGGIISPFLIDWLMISRGFNWKILFYLIIIGQFLLSAPSFFFFPTRSKVDISISRTDKKSSFIEIKRLLAIPAILLIFVSLFAASGLENGYTYYVDLFAIEIVQDPSISARTLSLFWFVNVIVRLLYSFWPAIKSKGLLVICFGSAAISITCLVLFPSVPLLIIVSCVLGGMFAPMWPLLQSQAMQVSPKDSATISGIMSIPCGAGAVILLIVSGVLSDFLSVKAAYIALIILAIIGFGTYTSYCRLKISKKTKSQIS